MEGFWIIEVSGLIVAAILLPGLSLSFALYPRRDELIWTERLGFSLPLGLLPFFILYAVSENLYVPITTTSTWASVLALMLGGLGIWRLRSSR